MKKRRLSFNKPKTAVIAPRGPAVYIALCAAGILLLIPGICGIFPANTMRILLQIFLYIALGQAWNLLSGFSGMTSLGQQLYIGLAGYAVAVATTTFGLSPLAGAAAGTAACVLLAAVLSIVLFRTEGMYFAIATWVAAEAMQKLFLNLDFVNQGSGMTVRIVPYPTVDRIYPAALLVCVFSIFSVCLVLRSRLGLGLMAMRDDPEAAAASGINTIAARLSVYILAAVICALAGSVFFVNKGTIYPESGFSSGWTVSSVFICIIGGSGTVAGPVAGAVLYVFLSEFLAHYPGWSNIMLGMITLFVIFFLPEGIAGFLQKRLRITLFSLRRLSDFPKTDRKKNPQGRMPRRRP